MKYLCPLMIFLTATGAYGQDLPSIPEPVWGNPDIVVTSNGVEQAYRSIDRTIEARTKLLYDVMETKAKDGDNVRYRGLYKLLGEKPLQLHNGTFGGYNKLQDVIFTPNQIDPFKGPAGEKGPGTPGILGGSIRTDISNAWLINECASHLQDGGLIGWSVEGDQILSFDNCIVDGRYRCDWTVYGWSPTTRTDNRQVIANGTDFYTCRLGIGLYVGGGSKQYVECNDCNFYCDANGSKSNGATSKMDPDSGGLLAAVCLRNGFGKLTRCNFWMTGLREIYKDGGKDRGVPRMACVTDRYYTASPGAKFELIDCRVMKMEPNTAVAWFDADVRGKIPVAWNNIGLEAKAEAEQMEYNSKAGDLLVEANKLRNEGKQLVAAAKGGSGAGGEVTVWKPTEVTK